MRRVGVGLALLISLAGSAAFAQRGGSGGFTVRRPKADTFTGDFTFCRIAFRAGYGGYGGGWGGDYPRADENLSIRLSELSEAAVKRDQSRARGVHARGNHSAPRLPAQGRVSVGRRCVGQPRVGSLAGRVEEDSAGL